MEHVVFFPAPDGSPAFRRVATLEAAVRFVEHLRNAEGITEVSMHALTEVPLAFRAWYSVEVPGSEPVPEAAAPLQPAVAAPAALSVVPDPPVVDAEPAVEPAAEPVPTPQEQPAEAPSVEAQAAEQTPVVQPDVVATPVLVAVPAQAPAAEPVAEPAGEPAPLTSLGFFA